MNNDRKLLLDLDPGMSAGPGMTEKKNLGTDPNQQIRILSLFNHVFAITDQY